MPRILAIDYGKKRVGLAISDELGLCANPYGVLKNDKFLFDKILSIVKNFNISKIIVGFPVWDKPSNMIEEIKEFINKIRIYINVEIELVNEFYSTEIAKEKVHSIGKKYKKIKNKIDSYAACVILQDYLDKINI